MLKERRNILSQNNHNPLLKISVDFLSDNMEFLAINPLVTELLQR